MGPDNERRFGDASGAETVAGEGEIRRPATAVRGGPPAGVDQQVWNVLCQCRALATVSPAALQDILAAAVRRSFQPGDAMMTQGEPADGLLILLEGAAHARLRGHDGEERCIGHFTSGDLVGEMALVTREPRSATVVADSLIQALLVPTAAFDRLAGRHFDLGVMLTELVADRLGRGAHDGLGGKQVEGFRILRCVGRGAMSVVYRAENQSTGELVALKMMSYRLIYNPAALARFHQEAALLQDLDHANIAHLKRLFPAYHTFFLVMELCEGVDLQRLVASAGPLSEARVRPILGQLARALEYVHAHGVVHRDLKPGNVMITRDGDVKLTDFGLATPSAAMDDRTRIVDHAVVGTPAFMAPEQLAGGVVDRRTDIYALGCLAYDLLTGRHLFDASSNLELLQKKLGMPLPPAADIGEGLSAELYDFLQRAVRVNPDERPSSLASLVEWAAPCQPPPAHIVDEQVRP